jgi:thiamine biosynthesis lipoprotein ApbE
MKIAYWLAVGLLLACNLLEQSLLRLDGKTMGTTYYISYKPVRHESSAMKDEPSMIKTEIDSLRVAFMVMGLEETMTCLQQDTSLNTYLIYADENGAMRTTQTNASFPVIREISWQLLRNA